MPRYKCSWCGKAVTRYGKQAREAKEHFCNRHCRSEWLKKRPVNENWKKNKKTFCIVCLTPFISTTSSSRYCPLCKNLAWNLNGYLKNNDTDKTEDYLRYLLDHNKKTDIVKEILRRREKSNIEIKKEKSVIFVKRK